MSSMGTVALIIEEARRAGINLTLGDFSRDDGGELLVQGLTIDQWMEAHGL